MGCSLWGRKESGTTERLKNSMEATQVLLVVKNPPASVGGLGSIPGWGRPPGGGNGTHSSIRAWNIPWTEEPGGLQSMGSQGVGLNQGCSHVHTISIESGSVTTSSRS